jgi:hypothetical protein
MTYSVCSNKNCHHFSVIIELSILKKHLTSQSSNPS